MAPWHGSELAPAGQQYFRSDSSDSAAHMLGSAGGDPLAKHPRGPPRCSRLWLAVAALGILALQIASATGLFVYFTVSIAKLKAQAQGNSEELRCLLLLNRVQDLEELVGNQSCLKLAGRIKDYVATVMKDMNRIQQETSKNLSSSSDRQLADRWPGSRPSAHLTLGRQRTSQPGSRGLFGELQQSCQHPVYQWKNATMHAHLQNVTYLDGKLQVHQPGRYYVYAQIYFRYPTESAHVRSSSRQLVQCVNLQSSYGQNSLLLKGVGTKCWAQDATYGLYALYQGGLFDLKAGDKLFVSVSSLDINYNDEAGSYFGAFRLPG
ncbi:tumor necrosis factor ligand superfamily member 10 [Pogona vitticeps]